MTQLSRYLLSVLANAAGFALVCWRGEKRTGQQTAPGKIKPNETPIPDALGVTFRSPVPGGIVSGVWGDLRAYRNGIHRGIDISKASDMALATASGFVVEAHDDIHPTAGKYVVIQTKTKIGSSVFHRYLHLASISVKKDAWINAGEPVGEIGNTGCSAVHLHYDMLGDPETISLYKKLYGTPKDGFPPKYHWGVYFPSEPFIAISYKPASRARAIARGIPVLGT